MSEIVRIKLSDIDPNPLRQLAAYPYNADKLATLERSIRDVGLWEGVIGRLAGNRVEIAFGHHRCEAARRVLGEHAQIDVIVRPLSDEQMLKFMGRENMEDYNSDFLILLETWEAAEHFLARTREQKRQATDIARVLGWTRLQPSRNKDMLDDAASACASASELLQGGYFQRSELAGLSVRAARDILERVVSHHRTIDKTARVTGRSAQEVTESKRVAAKAGAAAARDVREGRVAQRNVRGAVDVHAYRIGKASKRQTPLFEVFARTLTDQIARVAANDSIAEKLNEIVNALSTVEMREDVETVERVAFECDEASKRFAHWHAVLHEPRKRVVPLKQIERQP